MSREDVAGPSRGAAVAMVGALVRRPGLWPVALGAVGHLAPPGWWHRPPYLPLPDQRLWAFRMETAYGRPEAVPPVEDVIAYLRWCRRGGRPGRARPPARWGPLWSEPNSHTRTAPGAVQQVGPAKFRG